MTEEATIRRGVRNARYTTMPNHVLEDTRLSMEARWLLGYLLSKPDNWTVRMADIAKKGVCGRDKARRMVGELVEHGYAEKEQARADEGKFGRLSIVVYDEPADQRQASESLESQGVAFLPQTENPSTVEPSTDEPSTVNAALAKTDSLAIPERSFERERASEPEDPKKVDAEGWALLKDWPGFAGMPKEPALKVWRQLTADERAEASRKFAAWLALLKAQHKSHIPAPSTYIGQKLFREVPEPADDKLLSIEARPFGKLWQAVRLKLLLAEPTGMIPELTWIERQMVEAGKADEAELRRDKRSRHGWPVVNALHDAASYGKSAHASPGHEPLSAMMVQVRVGSEDFEAWKLEHQLRGWPWLPDPGRQEWVYFPAGGPQEGLRQFEQAVRGNNVDGRAQAAE